MTTKLTVVLDAHVATWLRQFAQQRDMSMGEVVRIELEALYQNDLASQAMRTLTADLPEPVR